MGTTQLNALDVLLQALPSEQGSSLAKQFGVTTSASSSTAYRTATTTSLPSSTSTVSQITTTPTPAPQVDHRLSSGVVAGIATASISAVVIILLLLLYFLRLRPRDSHRRNASETSLLGSISGSITKTKKNKVFPEVAWLYDPERPSSRNHSTRTSNDSGAKLGANAPWSSRPSTGDQHGRSLTALPRLGTAELPAIPVARAIDPSFLEASQEDRPRRFSYPLRPVALEGATPDEVISPLLPPPPPSMARGGREQRAYHPSKSLGYGQGGTRGHTASLFPEMRPPTRHGPVHAL